MFTLKNIKYNFTFILVFMILIFFLSIFILYTKITILSYIHSYISISLLIITIYCFFKHYKDKTHFYNPKKYMYFNRNFLHIIRNHFIIIKDKKHHFHIFTKEKINNMEMHKLFIFHKLSYKEQAIILNEIFSEENKISNIKIIENPKLFNTMTHVIFIDSVNKEFLNQFNCFSIHKIDSCFLKRLIKNQNRLKKIIIGLKLFFIFIMDKTKLEDFGFNKHSINNYNNKNFLIEVYGKMLKEGLQPNYTFKRIWLNLMSFYLYSYNDVANGKALKEIKHIISTQEKEYLLKNNQVNQQTSHKRRNIL